MAVKGENDNILPDQSISSASTEGDTGYAWSSSSTELQGDTGSSGALPKNSDKDKLEYWLKIMTERFVKLEKVQKELQNTQSKSLTKVEETQKDIICDIDKKFIEFNSDLKTKQAELEKSVLIKLSEKLSEAASRSLNQLAIFVAMFTFVAVNFIFFATGCITAVTFVGLALTLIACLIIFVVLLSLNTVNKGHTKFEVGLVIIATMMLVSGGIFVVLDRNSYKQCQQKIEEKALQIK